MNLRMGVLGAGLLILMFSVSAQGDDSTKPNFSAAYEACVKNTISYQVMIDCNNAELKRQQASLDSIYKKILDTMTDTAFGKPREAFVNAQSAWRAHRDAECKFRYERETVGLGGGYPVIVFTSCLLDMTADRVKELDAVMDSLSPEPPRVPHK